MNKLATIAVGAAILACAAFNANSAEEPKHAATSFDRVHVTRDMAIPSMDDCGELTTWMQDRLLTMEPGMLCYDLDDHTLRVWDGAGWYGAVSGMGTPGGRNGMIQYNNNGAFGGASGIVATDGVSSPGPRLTFTGTRSGVLFVGNIGDDSHDRRSGLEYISDSTNSDDSSLYVKADFGKIVLSSGMFRGTGRQTQIELRSPAGGGVHVYNGTSLMKFVPTASCVTGDTIVATTNNDLVCGKIGTSNISLDVVPSAGQCLRINATGTGFTTGDCGSGSGGGLATWGVPAVDQIAIFGSGGTSVGGTSDLTWDGTNRLTVTNLTVANPISGSITGNAPTATALASVPTLCSSGQAAQGVLANGNATGCTAYLTTGGTAYDSTRLNGQLAAYYAQDSAVAKLSGNQTIAGTKTFSSTIVGSISGNAATATALAANPTDCGANQYATAIDAGGNLTCSTPPGGGTVSTSGSPSAAQLAIFSSGSVITGNANVTWDGTTVSAPSFTSTGAADGTRGVTITDNTTHLAAPGAGFTALESYGGELYFRAGASGSTTALSYASKTETLTNKSITGGQITSAVATATALAANGTNCGSGQAAMGVDASGNAEGCFAPGDVTGSSTTTFTNKTYDAEGTGNTLTVVDKVWLPAAGCNDTTAGTFWDLPTASPAVPACVTGTNVQKGVLDFADTSGGFYAQNTVLLPADWTGSIGVRVLWTTTATTGDAKWSVSTACANADGTETDDPSWNTANTVTTTAPGTASRVAASAISSLTTTGCGAGDLLHIRVFRDGNDASDTIAATARLIGVELTIRRAE